MIFSWKKCAALLLFWSAAAFLFGENYFSFSLGYNYYIERFPDDSYTRQQNGVSLTTGYYFFPADFPLGLLAQISIGRLIPFWEENARESMKARENSSWEIQAVIAPSFRFKLGSSVHLPISLGAIFVFTSERSTDEHIPPGGTSPVSPDHFYRSLNGGIHADAAFVFLVSSGGFFLKPGISLNYIFLRAEKGEMWMNYRTTHNNRFKGAPYHSFSFTIYFGVGIKN